jgi:ribonuclease HI
MDIDTVVCQLMAYGRRHSDTRGQFAAAAAKYLGLRKEFGRVHEGMFDDPLLREIIDTAALETACGWRRPDMVGPSVELQTIYCDGCCLSNGRAEARAGFGVYVINLSGTGLLSESFRVPVGDPQTNQRAELLALRYALSIVAEHPSVVYDIYTDSRYAIDCLTKWCNAWEASGWRKSDNKPVLHAEIIQDCLTMFRSAGDRVRLHHIAAHTGFSDAHSRGNAEADRLARVGAELSEI